MRRTLLLSGAIGLLLAGLMMYIAWEHNPQGEFRSEAGVEWRQWLGLGALWFLLPIGIGSVWATVRWFTREQP